MGSILRGAGRIVAGAVAALACTTSVSAGGPAPVIQVPNPGTLTLVSTAVVVGVIATRWLRRK
jgi:hypothetical protein